MDNPKDRRLQADYDKVLKLISESGGTLKLIRALGHPPTSYVIEYQCPSLVKSTTGKITTRNIHQVEINLGANYPFEKPITRMITPVFNPHVYSHNAICLGIVWSAAETLDTLILRIGALLQLDPRVLNPSSPANPEANQWVQQNRTRIPLGIVSFKARQESKKRIEWS
jgi:ubiquitin-protein ligase